jgi:1-acyl-sn-glycerol-3-phosphate acyltransferase
VIYKFLKQIIKAALFFFFRKIVVSGKEQIPVNGPLIIVANHPNTFMDPLLVAAITDQRIGFVANAGIFLNKLISRVFTYFHVIPIYRKKDIQPGEKPDNRMAFSKCHDYLGEQGTLLIFPEGTSYYELKLREIKTGTARIALSFEDLKGFEGNLKVVPVALDYSDSIQFRSVVSVTVCRPISVHAYKLAYDRNEFGAAVELTEAIRKELADIIPQTSGKEQEKFLVRAHQFYVAFYGSKEGIKIKPKQFLELRNLVSKALQFIQKEDSALYLDTQTKLLRFFKLLKNEGLRPNEISNVVFQKGGSLQYVLTLIKFISLFPLYLLGLLTNYVPYMLTAKIFTALKLDIEYKAPVQMITGFFTFPFYYALMIWLFRMHISTEFWYSLLLFVLMPISGYITLYYYAERRRFLKRLHFDFFIRKERKEAIIQLKDDILENMEEARNYLNVN